MTAERPEQRDNQESPEPKEWGEKPEALVMSAPKDPEDFREHPDLAERLDQLDHVVCQELVDHLESPD